MLVVALAAATTVTVVLTRNSGTIAATPDAAPPPPAPPGAPGARVLPPADQVVPHQVVRHIPGNGQPARFGGTPLFDACTVLPLTALPSTGFTLEAGPSNSADIEFARVLGDASHDPGAVTASSSRGVSQCAYPGDNANSVRLHIYQPPYDQPKWRTDSERVLRDRGAVEGQAHGLRTQIAQDPKTGMEAYWDANIYGPDVFASVMLRQSETDRAAAGQIMTAVVDRVAQGLVAGPTAPGSFHYIGQWDQVKAPCEAFRAEDFEKIVGVVPDVRPDERYSLIEAVTLPESTMAQVPMVHVKGECTHRNQSAANSGTGSTPAQSMTVKLSTFLTPEMAANANDYDCDPGNKHRHPYGPPKRIPFTAGDGASCLINMADHQAPMAFKAGRTTVRVSMWSPRALGTDENAVRVYSSVAEAISRAVGGV
ncbi:hypothetical protein [Amycolatopsis magusensis]|uniref:hypothetical protein n=1 Tax=Amycolatopsis magusensis TaxID=882444 RepID=UPI0037AF373C